MTRIAFSLLLLSTLILSSCEKKPSETADSQTKDSLKKDSATVSVDTSKAPVSELSGKAGMIAGKWKATEFETPTIKLSGELTDIRFDFKKDMTFEYFEDGKKDNGIWKLNDQENQVMLTYQNNVKSDLDIKELKEGKLVLSGKEHGMYRTYVLAPMK